MKVLQVLPELNAGGVERGTLELADFLVRHGHEAVVVSHGGRLVAELESLGARHLTRSVHRKSPLSLLQVRPFRRLLEREQPDVLHIRSRMPGWIAWLAWRGMEDTSRPRLVSTVHGFNSVNSYSAIMTRGERVIAVSTSVRDYILRHYARTSRAIIRVIPRGIDPTKYAPEFRPSASWMDAWRREFPSLTGRRILTLPGRITRLKGHEDFLRLLQALHQMGEPVAGLIAGGAHEKKRSYLAELQSLVQALGLSEIVAFTGHRSDLREILAASDIVYSLTSQPESFGRTTLEALALGRPVAAYSHGGVGELLERFFPVGAVPPADFKALLATTKRVLSSTDRPAKVDAPYTLTAMCEATLNTYCELLELRGAVPAPSQKA